MAYCRRDRGEFDSTVNHQLCTFTLTSCLVRTPWVPAPGTGVQPSRKHFFPRGTHELRLVGLFLRDPMSGCVSRAAFYVDGYNLYHAIDDLNNPIKNPQLQPRGPFHHLKWLCLWTLAHRLISKGSESLQSVHYFSAWANHRNPQARQKQDLYVRALTARGVRCQMAHFGKENFTCRPCGHSWVGYVEKETDVNIALAIANDAYRDIIDTFYLISADADLVPVYRLFRSAFPQKS